MSSVDVLVYGPTAAGVLAAVAARRAGAGVVLTGPEEHVGGMVASGLSWTDVGREDVVSGLTRHFYRLVAAHYSLPLFALKGPEPHVAERIFLGLLEQHGVEVVLGAELEGLQRDGNHVAGLRSGGQVHEAAVFVDASYEGDLMAAAGIPYRTGREPKELHQERWAGRQPAYRPGAHNFTSLISPFAGPAPSELLPEIVPPVLDERGWPQEALGQGDGALQAYQLRLCMTDCPGNQLPLEEPPGYDPGRFEVLRRHLRAAGESVQPGRLLGLVQDLLPNGKCDVNSIGPFSLNLLDGSNRAYPEADRQGRAAIYEHHRRYCHELLHFLRHDPDVPGHVRATMGRWSLCADEFEGSGGWPHQLYVREARRMVGSTVLTENDLLEPCPHPGTIATGSYNIDIREIERTWRYLPEYIAQPAVFNEGYLSVAVPPYPIPYRCLLPREQDADNVIVPVCCSASHIAYGSLRTEPTLMALGEVAGTAAALASDQGRSPVEVGPELVREQMTTSSERLLS